MEENGSIIITTIKEEDVYGHKIRMLPSSDYLATMGIKNIFSEIEGMIKAYHIDNLEGRNLGAKAITKISIETKVK